VHRNLGWLESEQCSQIVIEIEEMLKGYARADGAQAEISEAETGAIYYGRRS